MARQESDREDLIREATALKNRIEWRVPGRQELAVAGLKSDDSLSVYFGQDPVYHFSPVGQLRRSYCDGYLYRSHGTTLAKLTRERTSEATSLSRVDLSAQELDCFLSLMRQRIALLRDSIQSGTVLETRRVVDGRPFDIAKSLNQVLAAAPALAPAYPTRRD